MGIVLSHTTAKAVYQAAYSVVTSTAESFESDVRLNAAPSAREVIAAKGWLSKHGIDLGGEDLEVLVPNLMQRRICQGLTCHATRQEITRSELNELGENVFIVSIERCALEAATYLSLPELVEYYFELCSAYALEIDDPTDYSERPALTSTVKLKRYFDQAKNQHGIDLARKAIRYVRDGCRSPMETAFVMMLTLPRRFGGLGIRDIETDYEIKVAKVARELTRHTKFYFDAYLRRSKTDIEYNGFYHDSDENRAIDEERKNALKAMGFEIVTVSRHSFFDKNAFARVMLSIIRREGIRPSRLPENFFVEQENLRQFVLRRYIEKAKREDERRRAEQSERDKAAQENEMALGIVDDPSINDVPEIADMQQINVFEDNADTDGRIYGSLSIAED